MPNPKSGTVTMDVADAVKEFKSGKVDFRVDKFGILHTSIGKASFDADKLKENAWHFLQTVNKLGPLLQRGTISEVPISVRRWGPAFPNQSLIHFNHYRTKKGTDDANISRKEGSS
jgi:large subunit ribosomal protein L1